MPATIEEMQSPSGPLRINELLIQKIWKRRDFCETGLRTTEGEPLRIHSTGVWNRLEGPDFLGAEITVGSKRMRGDVEIHFHQSDWRAHGHGSDPRHANVVLHVALFAPRPEEAPATTVCGRRPATLFLLPCLDRMLEEHAAEEAMAAGAEIDLSEAALSLLRLEKDARARLLIDKARARWGRKTERAMRRIEAVGWQAACHQTLFEILGHSRNRAPMLAIAREQPLEACAKGGLSAEALFQQRSGEWRLNGCRPANRPEARLRQALSICQSRPNWPDALMEFAASAPAPAGNAGAARARKLARLPQLRARIEQALLGGALGGGRLDTFVCDGLLPLSAAASGRKELFGLWSCWPPGDAPDSMRQALSLLELSGGRRSPLCNGLIQGAIEHFLIERPSCANGLAPLSPS